MPVKRYNAVAKKLQKIPCKVTIQQKRKLLQQVHFSVKVECLQVVHICTSMIVIYCLKLNVVLISASVVLVLYKCTVCYQFISYFIIK